ncbi:MAG: NADH-quinone oxidoreductase subunit J [Candidatus Thermoplasmatota archaeon]
MNRRMTLLFGGAVALALFAMMGLAITGTQPWDGEGTQENVTKANDQASVVDTLFGPQVVAFEVLGILLTAAMIGALVIARPVDAEADDSHYTHPTPAQVAESDKASDPATHSSPTTPSAEGPQ